MEKKSIYNWKNNLFGTKSTISLIDKKYTWRSKNMWMTSWQIENEQGEVVEIKPSSLNNGGK
jgi:hypothetical protein